MVGEPSVERASDGFLGSLSLAFGDITIESVRPSVRGGVSTMATSARSVTIAWMILYPSSW